MLAQDPESRVACETMVTTGLVLVTGEITSRATVDVTELVRSVVRRIGYSRPEYGFDADSCAVLVALKKQSPDIDQGVSRALEVRTGTEVLDPTATIGAGDQGMMYGFACDES